LGSVREPKSIQGGALAQNISNPTGDKYLTGPVSPFIREMVKNRMNDSQRTGTRAHFQSSLTIFLVPVLSENSLPAVLQVSLISSVFNAFFDYSLSARTIPAPF
jgi:hypothetical protein